LFKSVNLVERVSIFAFVLLFHLGTFVLILLINLSILNLHLGTFVLILLINLSILNLVLLLNLKTNLA
jgi:hypothetical protein